MLAERRQLALAWAALVRANVRYWATVAPAVRTELARWRVRAGEIEGPELRALALEKLAREGFAAEVAATLATLAPRARRHDVTRTIVALEVMYDYLDGVSERPAPDALANTRLLFEALIDALALDRETTTDYHRLSPLGSDGGYVRELVATVGEGLARLPEARALAPAMATAARRCAEAEGLIHASALTDTPAAESWARRAAAGSGLEWREYLAGAASSVLSLHALIALAANERVADAQASAIDAVYLALATLSTLLDSIADYERDRADGTVAFLRYYKDFADFSERVKAVIELAADRASGAPDASHHLMTLAGVVAFWTTEPGARGELARPVARAAQAELRPLIAPVLALMRAWRLAKRIRAA